jgi:hypothetical protein
MRVLEGIQAEVWQRNGTRAMELALPRTAHATVSQEWDGMRVTVFANDDADAADLAAQLRQAADQLTEKAVNAA